MNSTRYTHIRVSAAIALAFALLSSGCAAASGRVRMLSEANGPVSLTGTVYSPDGEPLRVGSGLEVVGHFDRSRRVWSLLFGAISLSGDIDMGKIANEEMDTHDGHGLVNVAIESSSNGALKYLGTLLPIIPMYVSMRIEGDVVRATQP